VSGRALALPSTVVHDPGGATDRSDLVLVHGFTQTGRSWAPVVPVLAAALASTATDRRIVTVDLPGHGAADPALDDADLPTTADLLAETTGRAMILGYSMGGRVALRLALDRPDLVDALVLVGATAGIDDPTERAARRRADDVLAAHVTDVGTAAFVDEWLSGPLFTSLVTTSEDRDARAANRAEGLAASLRAAGTGTMDPPWWDELPGLTVPVLLVTGGRDAKFAAIADRMAEAIGDNATRCSIPDAGHAVHLERPVETAEAIGRWSESTGHRP
jgi:2-succinyl-6-hydroxy-2,4-cyclohexadiene-1-carboxylate synthase